MTLEQFSKLETTLLRRIDELTAKADNASDDEEYDAIYAAITDVTYMLVEVIRGKEYIAEIRKQTVKECMKGLTVVV